MFTQAQKIIEKFGGVNRLAAALDTDVSAIYKWNYPKIKGGTDGLVPSSKIKDVLTAADALGIWLDSTDFDPREEPIHG